MHRMKTVCYTLVLLAAVACLVPTGAVAQDGGMRYTISVTEFENKAGWSGRWNLGDAWGEVMTDMLNQSGRFIVLGESDMRGAALDEQDFAASGRTAGGAKAPVTGQMTPAQLLVKGAVTHVENEQSGGGGGIRVKGIRVGGNKEKAEMNVTVYLVDATTGQVVASTNVVGEANRRGARFGYSGRRVGGDVGGFQSDNVGKAMEDAVSQSVEWLVDQLPNVSWTGSVVMVKDNQVYINRGTREGVSSGQTFVVGEETVIRDPDTGEVLDASVDRIATLKATSVKEKLTICDVVSGSASGVRKGMAVHLP